VERAEGLRITYEYFKNLSPEDWNRQPKEFESRK
jgi:dTDP-glucose 4,6-dehydratase